MTSGPYAAELPGQPNTPGGGTIPSQIGSMDRPRLRDYQLNLDFYAGRQWPVQRRNIRQRRLTFNYARTIVDKGASYLLKGLQYSVDAEDEQDRAEASRRERVLHEMLEANGFPGQEYDAEIDCGVLGDGCFKVSWDDDEKRVRITSPDVSGVFVWLYPDDHTRFWRVAHRYTVDPLAIRNMEQFYPNVLITAQRNPSFTEVWTNESYELYIDNMLADAQPNPYGFIPYVVYPNLRRPKQFWGESDIAAVREPCIELNRALTQLSQIMEVSGNPITVLEGVIEGQDIAVEPGAVWEMPAGTRAYLLSLLEHGGMQMHTDYIEMLYRLLHDLGESPRAAFGGSSSGPGAAASGLALAIELDPLTKRVERKRLIRSQAYGQRNAMAMRLHEKFTGEPMAPYRSRPLWGSLLPVDRSRDVLDEIALVNSGIHSREQAANTLGDVNHEIEFAAWLEENRQILASGGIPAEPSQADRLQST